MERIKLRQLFELHSSYYEHLEQSKTLTSFQRWRVLQRGPEVSSVERTRSKDQQRLTIRLLKNWKSSSIFEDLSVISSEK